MKIECFRIKDNGALERDDAETCLERWRGGEGRYWIDIERSETEERAHARRAISSSRRPRSDIAPSQARWSTCEPTSEWCERPWPKFSRYRLRTVILMPDFQGCTPRIHC